MKDICRHCGRTVEHINRDHRLFWWHSKLAGAFCFKGQYLATPAQGVIRITKEQPIDNWGPNDPMDTVWCMKCGHRYYDTINFQSCRCHHLGGIHQLTSVPARIAFTTQEQKL